MDHIEQRNAPSLTPELWAKVLSLTEELPEFSCGPHLTQKRHQARVHQRKLVCKQFRDVFASHPGLVQRLYLWSDFSVTALPGLLAWLQKSKSSISMFQSVCRSPLVDIVMAAFLSEPSIKFVDTLRVNACTISIVGTFTSLEKCSLRHTQAEYVGLAPLGALQSLKYLILSGNFKEIHHLAGLTRLQFTDARVLGVQELAPTLQHLEIHDSTLLGIHAQGLSACTALTMLVLDSARLMGNHEDMYLDGNLSLVPANKGC